MLLLCFTPSASGQEGLGRIDARADSVFRWNEGKSEAYLLEGRCNLDVPEGFLSSDQMLVMVEPLGESLADRRWHIRIAATGHLRAPRLSGVPLSPGQTTWKGEWKTVIRPTVDAPLFRGPPTAPPKLLEVWVPPAQATPPQPLGTVAQVQFEELAPPATLPPPGQPPAPGAFGAELNAPVPPRFEPIPGGLLETPAEPLPTPPRVRSYQPPGDGSIIGPDEPLLPAQPQANDARFQLLVGGGSQSVEIFSRGSLLPAQIEMLNRPQANESVVVARGGVTVLVRDVQAQLPTGQLLDLGTVSLSADRIVAWFPLVTGFLSGETSLSDAEGEIFLEGNIVFRQGERVIYADSMYYNITRQYGMVLAAEAITPMLDHDGVVRLKADVLQQVSRGEFIAFDAAVTSSRMGVPRYWLQSEQLRFSDQTRPGIDPVTGLPTQVADRVVSSRNNFVYLGGVPILYWPRFSSDMRVSSFYLSGINVRSDSIFGQQAYLDWDMFQLLGFDRPPEGVEWLLSTDYLSQRGPALGTTVRYDRDYFLGMVGPTSGFLDTWWIRDTGLDILGRGRRDLVPEKEYRGRVLGRHRQTIGRDFEWIAEVGYLSDRNFLDQYFEQEWDQDKDHDTNLRLRKYRDNQMVELAAEARVNPFYMETQRLPRLEHFLLGGSLLADRLTWSMKNQVGYADLNVADAPLDPVVAAGTLSPLPGEANASGIIAATKQEVAMPLELGPVKFVPFLSGEASHYGEDINGDSLTRLIGQAGVRSSLPMWRVDPNVQSSLLNVRGLSHRIEWMGEMFYADSNTNFSQLPLYDRLDDNAQEEFRRRFAYTNYGFPPFPDRFDPRTYSLRHGMQRFVTNPAEVVADDLLQARLGLHQRWQTKRGGPGRERIVDLMRFDVNLLLFPSADRDNFGETVGPTTFDFRYHLGDRVSFVSDGYFDFFEDGLRTISAGVRTSRPGTGEVYVGLLSIEGPVSSQVIRSAYDYRMNEKWILTAMNTYDFGSAGNVGQNVALTRVGESFLFRVGLDIDRGRDNVGLSFMLEPRFLPPRRLGRVAGQWIPPVGSEGLE